MKTKYTKHEAISPAASVSQDLQEFILQASDFETAEIKNSQPILLGFSVGRWSFVSSWCVLPVLLCVSVLTNL